MFFYGKIIIGDKMNLNTELDKLNLLAREFTDKEPITENDYSEAMYYLKTNPLETTEDYFIFFAAINLINSFIKENKGFSYSFKSFIKRGIDSLIDKPNLNIKFSYTKDLILVQIYNMQFTFHSGELSDKMKTYKVEEINWSGIRLQPIALSIFNLARKIKQ